MAYRILLREDDSDSGAEQVAPPKGRHLRPDIKCGGFTLTSLDPKTQAVTWADNICPAPSKEWEVEFNWQLAASWSQGLRPRLHLLGMTAADQARRHCASDARALPPR